MMLETIDFLETAIEAIKKQIPQKPKAEGYIVHCPSCGNRIITSKIIVDAWGRHHKTDYPKFCKDCGQAIDFGED